MHRLIAAMRRMMEPSEPKRRPLMNRSWPVKSKKLKKTKKPSEKIVTKREAHLDFFNKSCKAKNSTNPGLNDENDEDE